MKYTTMNEILAIIDHARETLRKCALLPSIPNEFMSERCQVARDDLETLPGLIAELRTGRKMGREIAYKPRKIIDNRVAHYKRRGL